MLFAALFLFGPTVGAQTCDGNGKNFVDLDGDGFNDNAPDADGDGIPNGLDPDYIKHEQDGDGYKNLYQYKHMFKNEMGNLVRTNYLKFNQVRNQAMGSSFQGLGFGSSEGGPGIGERAGDGVCDGTGPKGKGGQN